jgi:Disulphide bond corrector protein DsbC
MRHLVARMGHAPVVLVCSLVIIIGVAWYIYSQAHTGYMPMPPFVQRQMLAGFTENGVHVNVALEQDRNGVGVLASTFTPIDAQVHLYSTNLPRTGLNGAGRPTLVEVPMQPDISTIGSLTANQPVILDRFATLNTAFPIYPDGPVTLRLPIVIASGDEPVPTTISVTYMACSSTGFCLPPVENKLIAVSIPRLP